jgi:hypothetical protein
LGLSHQVRKYGFVAWQGCKLGIVELTPKPISVQ